MGLEYHPSYYYSIYYFLYLSPQQSSQTTMYLVSVLVMWVACLMQPAISHISSKGITSF
jgi:hypothetical protein